MTHYLIYNLNSQPVISRSDGRRDNFTSPVLDSNQEVALAIHCKHSDDTMEYVPDDTKPSNIVKIKDVKFWKS